MRITLVQATIAMTLYGIGLANPNYGQEVLDKEVSAKYQGITLKKVLVSLEKQTGVKFAYSGNFVNLTDKITIEATNKKLGEMLEELLKPRKINYSVQGDYIVLIQRKEEASIRLIDAIPSKGTVNESAILLTVSGTVKDKDGNSIAGVNVLEKGTTNGITTDADGRYALNVPDANAVLIFSFIGYITQEVAVNGRTVIDVSLAEDVKNLEEVVVIGYGTAKKANLTGAVSTIASEQLTMRPAPNVQNLLQGKISGLQITQNGGTPGADAGTMRIRGVGTFSSTGSNPLVLIDGVEGDITDLDPDNVESVSVLKDAASAAIYGARAANGVILINTKKGRAQDLSVEYHATFQAQRATRLPELLTNSADYMELWNEANERSGKQKYFTQEEIDAFRNNPNDPVNYPNFDWVDYMFKTAFAQNHHLSVNGGNEKTSFNLALGYLDQGGIVDLYDYKRYNFLFSLDTKINDWLTIGGKLQGLKKDITQDVQGTHNEAYFIMHAFGPGPNYTPTMTLPDGSTGYVARYSSSIAEWTVRNPAAILAQGSNVTRNYTTRPQVYAEVKLAKNLTWFTKGAVDFDYNFRKNHEHEVDNYYFKDGSYAHNGAVWNLGVRDDMSTTFLTTLYSTLNYNKVILSNHSLGLLLGYNQETAYYRSLNGSRLYFPTDNLRELNAGSSLNQSTSGTASEWAIQSGFGRFTYDFKSRYLFEANVRLDATSRIASDTRLGFFPSVSGAWRLSEESFMKDLQWLDDLKIRASWGQLGNQNVGTYPYQDVLSTTSYAFEGVEPGVRLNRLVDKTLKWETTTISDIGLELSVKNGMFYLTADWYNKFTDDILYSIPVPASVGLSAPTVNGGQLKNTGWDFELGHRHNIGQLRYSVDFNLSFYKNELVSILSPSYGKNIAEEGLPYNSYYLVEWIGIFQNQAEIDQEPKHPFNPKPGDLKYKDQNGDGVINASDRVVVDGYYPKFYYGGSLNLSFKNFDISAFFQGVEGVKNYFGGQYQAWGYTPFTQGSPPPMDLVKNRWTPENPTNEYPAIYEQSYQPVNGAHSTYWLHDASYLRLKNLRIGYTLPSSLIQKIGLKGGQVYVSGDNLFTITDYPGADPERSSLTSSYSVYPQLTSYTFGVKVKL